MTWITISTWLTTSIPGIVILGAAGSLLAYYITIYFPPFFEKYLRRRIQYFFVDRIELKAFESELHAFNFNQWSNTSFKIIHLIDNAFSAILSFIFLGFVVLAFFQYLLFIGVPSLIPLFLAISFLIVFFLGFAKCMVAYLASVEVYLSKETLTSASVSEGKLMLAEFNNAEKTQESQDFVDHVIKLYKEFVHNNNSKPKTLQISIEDEKRLLALPPERIGLIGINPENIKDGTLSGQEHFLNQTISLERNSNETKFK